LLPRALSTRKSHFRQLIGRNAHAFPCGKHAQTPHCAASLLARCAGGFGAVDRCRRFCPRLVLALDWPRRNRPARLGPIRAAAIGTLRAKAKGVIFLYMDGGRRQVDKFDPKPRMQRREWPAVQDEGSRPPQFNNSQDARLPVEISELRPERNPVSDLFPHMDQHVDEMAIVRGGGGSMTSNFSEHTNANYFRHTGSGRQGGRAWVLVRLRDRLRVPGRCRVLSSSTAV